MDESVLADTCETSGKTHLMTCRVAAGQSQRSFFSSETPSPLSAPQGSSFSASCGKQTCLCFQGTLMPTGPSQLFNGKRKEKKKCHPRFILFSFLIDTLCRPDGQAGLHFCCCRVRAHWSHTRSNSFFRYSSWHLLEEHDLQTTWRDQEGSKIWFSPSWIALSVSDITSIRSSKKKHWKKEKDGVCPKRHHQLAHFVFFQRWSFQMNSTLTVCFLSLSFTFPHARQWCRLHASVNSQVQIIHMVARRSGIHIGALEPSGAPSSSAHSSFWGEEGFFDFMPYTWNCVSCWNLGLCVANRKPARFLRLTSSWDFPEMKVIFFLV